MGISTRGSARKTSQEPNQPIPAEPNVALTVDTAIAVRTRSRARTGQTENTPQSAQSQSAVISPQSTTVAPTSATSQRQTRSRVRKSASLDANASLPPLASAELVSESMPSAFSEFELPPASVASEAVAPSTDASIAPSATVFPSQSKDDLVTPSVLTQSSQEATLAEPVSATPMDVDVGVGGVPDTAPSIVEPPKPPIVYIPAEPSLRLLNLSCRQPDDMYVNCMAPPLDYFCDHSGEDDRHDDDSSHDDYSDDEHMSDASSISHSKSQSYPHPNSLFAPDAYDVDPATCMPAASIGSIFDSIFHRVMSGKINEPSDVDLHTRLLHYAHRALPKYATARLRLLNLPPDATVREVTQMMRSIPHFISVEQRATGIFDVKFDSPAGAWLACLLRHDWVFDPEITTAPLDMVFCSSTDK